MSTPFDPYFEWFDIAVEEHPINYYRLLDLNRFESKPEVISAALERRINEVIEFLDGEHKAEAQKVLDELRIAGRVLLDEEAKLKYDIGLDPKRAPKPKTVLDPNARLQPKPKLVSEPELELIPEPELELIPDPELELVTESKSDSEPTSVLKEEEKPKVQDTPKPPLPVLTKFPSGVSTPTSHKQNLPKPPLMTKLPPGVVTPTSHKQDLPKPPVLTVLPPTVKPMVQTNSDLIQDLSETKKKEVEPTIELESQAIQNQSAQTVPFKKQSPPPHSVLGTNSSVSTMNSSLIDMEKLQYNHKIKTLQIVCIIQTVIICILVFMIFSVKRPQNLQYVERDTSTDFNKPNTPNKEVAEEVNIPLPAESSQQEKPSIHKQNKNNISQQEEIYVEENDSVEEKTPVVEEIVDNDTEKVISDVNVSEDESIHYTSVPSSALHSRFHKAQNAGALQVLNINGIEYRFRWCPPGEFMMGDSERKDDPNNTDIPHRIILTQGFWILETEVTQEMWISIMGENPSAFRPNGREAGAVPNMDTSQFPVDSVTWDQCQNFCEKVSQKIGIIAKLPTEAQWEYACRAGTTTPFNTGTELNQKQGNFKDFNTINPLDCSTKCKSFPPNAWGIYDMHGNVEEWCEDWYKQGYYHISPLEDPQGPEAGREKVVRGGNWYHGSSMCKSACRSKWPIPTSWYFSGFRFILIDNHSTVSQQKGVESVVTNTNEIDNDKMTFIEPKQQNAKTKIKSNKERTIIHNQEEGEKNSLQIKIDSKLKRKKNKPGEVTNLKINGIEYRFHWCPPGTFMMGSDPIQVGHNSRKVPNELNGPHPITLSKGFWMLETEVTQEMWQSIMGKNPSSFSSSGFNSRDVADMDTKHFPVEKVDWEECNEFCNIISQKLGMKVSLPTEAQWEYACRAGTTTPFNVGMRISPEYANIRDSHVVAPLERTIECGLYKPNLWGFYDMHGNVSEWCQDQYLQGYYKISPKVDPQGPENGKGHICRGGAWNSSFISCGSGERNHSNGPLDTIGFRFIIIQE